MGASMSENASIVRTRFDLFHFSTKLPNPTYSPEVCARTNIIDFAVTMKGSNYDTPLMECGLTLTRESIAWIPLLRSWPSRVIASQVVFIRKGLFYTRATLLSPSLFSNEVMTMLVFSSKRRDATYGNALTDLKTQETNFFNLLKAEVNQWKTFFIEQKDCFHYMRNFVTSGSGIARCDCIWNRR